MRADMRVNDVIINKVATIERCVQRVQEEYHKNPATFAHDFTRQDAALLNIQRACEACIDIGQYIIRRHKWGITQSARDIFVVLAQQQLISQELSIQLQKMVGFRNIIVHAYQQIDIDIVVAVIVHHLSDFLNFARLMLQVALPRPDHQEL